MADSSTTVSCSDAVGSLNQNSQSTGALVVSVNHPTRMFACRPVRGSARQAFRVSPQGSHRFNFLSVFTISIASRRYVGSGLGFVARLDVLAPERAGDSAFRRRLVIRILLGVQSINRLLLLVLRVEGYR